MSFLSVDRRDVLAIRQFPDAVLREQCRPATSDDDFRYIHDSLGPRMVEMVHAADALGLAAPQVGCTLQVFAFRSEDEQVQVAVNPRLELSGPVVSDIEGCLSLGALLCTVPRPRSVLMRAQDASGEEFAVEASDLWGRVLQHETDHLHGRLMFDTSPDVPLLSLWPNGPFGFERPVSGLPEFSDRLALLMRDVRVREHRAAVDAAFEAELAAEAANA